MYYNRGLECLGYDMAEQFAKKGSRVIVLDILENKEEYVDYIKTEIMFAP